MRTLLRAGGLALLLLLVASPALPEHRQEDYSRLAKIFDCTADIVTSDQHSPVDSYYAPAYHTVYIGTDPSVPEPFAWMIALHEIGHCLQYQEGTYSEIREKYETQKNLELDADMRGADMACRLGVDGPRLMRALFAWAKEVFNYEGDPNHGTVAERIAMADAAPSCQEYINPVQA